MSNQSLKTYFTGVAAKYLSAVDAESDTSNQHEIGKNALRNVLGDPASDVVYFDTRFIYLDDNDDKSISEAGQSSWYDTRRKNPNRGPELRLYYPNNAVTDRMAEHDLVVFAKRPDDTLLVVIAQPDSSSAQRLKWLFGLAGDLFQLQIQSIEEDAELSFATSFILQELGIELISDDDRLDEMLDRFDKCFPATKDFSQYAREVTETDFNPIESPDDLIVTWMQKEENLFMTLEHHFVSEKLDSGFSDVDEFVSYSLSIQNRRKSRTGHALENHLEKIFIENGLSYSRGAKTENNKKPDFLFPGPQEYHDPGFPCERLRMLGAKSTCKDRWRQVLSEAARINDKHLFTLEPAISTNQTDEMQSSSLQLVIPTPLHTTYNEVQQSWLLSLKDFIIEVST